MIRKFAAAALALTVGAASAAAQEADPAAAALAAARANVARVVTQVEWLRGPKPRLTQAELEQGHHGEVVVAGVLGEDGRLRHARVKTSSGAASLDALALSLAQAQVFEPARDAEGRALAVPINFPQEFRAYASDKPGGGLAGYSCRQFVRDMDWWRATHPEATWGDHQLYKLLLGLNMGSLVMRPGGMSGETVGALVEGFERRWIGALATCRAKPERRFNDVL